MQPRATLALGCLNHIDRKLQLNVPHPVELDRGTIALDSEREVEFGPQCDSEREVEFGPQCGQLPESSNDRTQILSPRLNLEI
jgi:hypothetical protein